MQRPRTLFLATILLLANASCSVNILENFADKETNGAYYNEAVKMINNADYDGAITEIAKMKGSYATSDAVISLKASAYTGRCSGKTILTLPRIAVLRSFVLSHNVHHRAQLGVYLRLNDVPVPSIYGPSADESGM